VLIVLISVGTLLYLNGDHPASPPDTTAHVQIKPIKDNAVPNVSLPQPSEKQATENKIAEENINHKNNKEITNIPEPYQQEFVWKNKELPLVEKETVAFQHNEIYAPVLENNINDFPEKILQLKKRIISKPTNCFWDGNLIKKKRTRQTLKNSEL
jgi:hypothetical protein